MIEPGALTDEELVRLIREGDESAFHVLSERYSARLRETIRRRLGPALGRKVAASDILQESYLTAFQRFPDFEDRGEGSFGRWFREIVTRKIRQAVRRHATVEKRSVSREVTRAGRGPTDALARHGDSPSQILVGEELREATRVALRELPDPYREVLALLREEHLSVDQAAERLGRSRDAVKMLYSRALARLEELLGLGGTVERRRPTR